MKAPNILRILPKEERVKIVNRSRQKRRVKDIPLTEEELIKLGFTITTAKKVYKRGVSDYNYVLSRDWRKEPSYHLGIEYTDSPYPEDSNRIYHFAFGIKYVHQLQNIWFDLVHEEIR